MQFVLFTDNLADLSVAGPAQSAKSAGFDGLDLTLRPGGHVRPENAEMGLAAAKLSADAAGLSIPMVSTALTDIDSPHAEAIFASAAHYGARLLKLGYWEYRPFGTLARRSRKCGRSSAAWSLWAASTTSCPASTATRGGWSPPADRCSTWCSRASSPGRSAPTWTRCT